MNITLEQAIIICRDIEERLKEIDYHCGLTGSILYKGWSEKDIDIIVYPHQVKEQKTVVDILRHLQMDTPCYPSQKNRFAKDIMPSTADKVVFVCEYKGIRIDFFFLI